MERPTYSAILERRKENKINKRKHVFRQALSRSILSQGSIRLVGHWAVLSRMREHSEGALPSWVVFQQCACLVKLYHVSVLSSLKERQKHLVLSKSCFLLSSSLETPL